MRQLVKKVTCLSLWERWPSEAWSERASRFSVKIGKIEYLLCKYSITLSVTLTRDSSPKGRAKALCAFCWFFDSLSGVLHFATRPFVHFAL